MHESAFEKAQIFRQAYLGPYEQRALTLLDICGPKNNEAHDQAFSHQHAFANPAWRYLSMGQERASHIDYVVQDPYDWKEVASASVDVVLCSHILEHQEFVWVTILEIARILKPNGLVFITSPASGPFHRQPVDCWRFYDDGLPALGRWADLTLVESQVQWRPVYRSGNQWRDAAIVLQRPQRAPSEEVRVSMKATFVKAALRGAQQLASLKSFDASQPKPSLIQKTGSRQAFLTQENHLLDEMSGFWFKVEQLWQHLKEMTRLVKTPIRSLVLKDTSLT